MPPSSAIRIVCISDTHGLHSQLKVPDADVLIHAGDFMRSGRDFNEIFDFNQWLGHLPHKHKIVIAGNHDLLFEAFPEAAKARLTNATYLENSGAAVLGLNFWGSPVQPAFNNWAFNVDRGAPIRKYWARIPDTVDVLVTHGPPFGILDKTDILAPHLGCVDLAEAVARVKPGLHVFGHIHGGYGQEKGPKSTQSVNCAALDEKYALANNAIVIEISPKGASISRSSVL
jgi:Icc-related predicted phosphoesterase